MIKLWLFIVLLGPQGQASVMHQEVASCPPIEHIHKTFKPMKQAGKVAYYWAWCHPIEMPVDKGI